MQNIISSGDSREKDELLDPVEQQLTDMFEWIWLFYEVGDDDQLMADWRWKWSQSGQLFPIHDVYTLFPSYRWEAHMRNTVSQHTNKQLYIHYELLPHPMLTYKLYHVQATIIWSTRDIKVRTSEVVPKRRIYGNLHSDNQNQLSLSFGSSSYKF